MRYKMQNKAIFDQINKAKSFYLKGNFKLAHSLIKKVLKKQPKNAEALHVIGWIQHGLGNYDLAISYIGDALKIKNDMAEWYRDLAIIYGAKKKYPEAVEAAMSAVKIKADYFEAYITLGQLLYLIGDYSNSVSAYAKAIQIGPARVSIYLDIARSLNKIGEVDQAIAYLLESLKIDDSVPEVYNDLGSNYFSIGFLDESIFCLKKLVDLTPDSAENLSCLIATLVYKYDFCQELMAEFLLYGVKHCLPLACKTEKNKNIPDCHKRLKIGYISADFYNHSIAFYILPILKSHDKSKFDIYCYYNNIIVDDYTYQMRWHSSHWIECYNLDDDQLARKIREDGIDILIDLSGHSVGNRLTVFAQKPAPIQFSWMGFPTTTGVPMIDYLILQEELVSDEARNYFSEEVIFTKKTINFSVPKNSPEVSDFPSLKNGYVTFASFNALYKVTSEQLNLWIEILKNVDRSRLILHVGKLNSDRLREYFLEKFVENGIERERVILCQSVPMDMYLRSHRGVDFVLDTYPYNGATTTLFALWMGVPVITLKGISPYSRISAMYLNRIGLSEFIAYSAQEYVDLAYRYSKSVEKLSGLRFSLRDNLLAHLFVEENEFDRGFVAEIENIYLNKWYKWCEHAKH